MLSLLRRSHTETHEPEHIEMPAPIRDATNPFTAMHDDLAARWDAMMVERDTALDEAARLRTDITYLSAEVDRLKRELEARTAMVDSEMARLQERADRAVDSEALMRGKLASARRLMTAILDDDVPAVKGETTGITVDVADPGLIPHSRNLNEPDTHVHELLNRLAPPEIK